MNRNAVCISYEKMSKIARANVENAQETIYEWITLQRYGAFQDGKKELFYQNVKVDIGPRFS